MVSRARRACHEFEPQEFERRLPDELKAVQVVRYLPGQQYRPHHDYFDPSDARYAEKCDDRGNRLLSFFVYLLAGFPGV